LRVNSSVAFEPYSNRLAVRYHFNDMLSLTGFYEGRIGTYYPTSAVGVTFEITLDGGTTFSNRGGQRAIFTGD